MAGKVISVPDDDVLVGDTNEDTRPRRSLRQPLEVDDVGFGELKDQLDKANKEREAERRGREEAERAARQSRADADAARRAAEEARAEGADTQKVALKNAITAKKQALDSLQTEHETAMEAGDFKKASALQRRMAEEAAELKTIEAGLGAIGDEPEPRRTTGRVERIEDARTEPPRREKTGDPFEDYVGQFQPATQEWLRRHPECVTNRVKNAKVIAAHEEALERGYKAESDAYWALIERTMGYKEDAARRAVAADNRDDDIDGDRGDDGRGRQGGGGPMYSGRVSRGGNGRSTDVHLTPGEVQSATDGTVVWNIGNVDHRGVVITDKDPRLDKPIGEYEFARRKKAMQRDGRYAVPYME